MEDCFEVSEQALSTIKGDNWTDIKLPLMVISNETAFVALP